MTTDDTPDRITRIVRLLSMLQRGPGRSSAGLAEQLDTSRRTILREVEALRGAGVGLTTSQDRWGSILLEGPSPAADTLLALDEDEALSVAMGSALIMTDAPDLGGGTAAECFVRTARLLGPGGRARLRTRLVEGGLLPDVLAGVRDPRSDRVLHESLLTKVWAIASARQDGQRVTFRETVGGPWRTCDPQTLIVTDRAWHLGWTGPWGEDLTAQVHHLHDVHRVRWTHAVTGAWHHDLG